MRSFIAILAACLTFSLISPSPLIAGPYSFPVALHTAMNTGVRTHVHTRTKQTNHFDLDPHIWIHGFPFKKKAIHHPLRPSHSLYPFFGSCRDISSYQETKRSRSKETYAKPFDLNQEIFNPTPKTPLTLIIKDGIVVDRYHGY